MQLFLLKEHQLLEGIARNDRKITEQVYVDNYKLVKAYLQSKGGSAEDVDDVFQEAMTILFQKAQEEQFRLSCKIGTYLVAISKHLWFKRLETLNKRSEIVLQSEDGEESTVFDTIPYQDDIKWHEEKEAHYAQLDLALITLGEPCQSLLKAFYQEQKSMQEIAKQFGYTNPENAKTQKYKCLSRLKKIFNATGN